MGQDRGDRLTFTWSWDWSDFLAARVALVVVILFGGALIAGPAWSCWGKPAISPDDIVGIVFGWSAGVAVIASALYAWVWLGPRTWEWDADGIAFRGPRGGRYLRWGDVERVRWKHDGVTLVGRGGRITLLWSVPEPGRRVEAYRDLFRILRADFDLPDLLRAEGEKPPFPWKALAKFAGVQLLLVAAMLIAYVLAIPIRRSVEPIVFDLFRDKDTVQSVGHLIVTMIWACLIVPFLIGRGPRVWYDRRLT